jgi:hypothetical protein
MAKTAVREHPEHHRRRTFLHRAWRVVKPVGEVLAAILAVLALVLIPAKTGSSPGVEQNLSDPAGRQVGNFQAAGGSPLAGDAAVVGQEQKCIAGLSNPGMFPTMAPSEHLTAARTHFSQCATWLGDYTNPGNNKVLAYRTPALLGGSNYDAVTGDPSSLYVYGGGNSNQSSYGVNQGPYLAKVNAQTLQIEWKTVLDNYNASGQWTVLSGVNYELGPGGKPALMVSYGHMIAKLDPATGQVLGDISLPLAAGTNPNSVNYETTIPSPDGTIITKTQTRPVTQGTSASSGPCTDQGFNAMVTCKGTQPDSQVTAIDPNTMKVLDSITLTQQIGGRNPLTVYNGHIYTYMVGGKNVVRVEWSPSTHTLTQDKSWYPYYYQNGMGQGAAPCIMGNWVIFNTNGGPGTIPMQIIAVNQGNPNDLHRISAIPLPSGEKSLWPSMVACDPQNHMIYYADTGAGQVAAVKINPATGDLTKAWGPVNQRTFSFFTLYGPANQRVAVASNINLSDPLSVFGVGQAVYGEQFIWRNAATGQELAHSSYVNGMTQGTLPTPGYGGLVYMLQSGGGVTAFQVVKNSSS